MARLMPQGALLFIEARDFSGMLREWSTSREKSAWLSGANHEVFSRSRLFERLKQAQDEFATAAGVPPDTAFLSQVAGRNSALAIYDIGKLELLYITRVPSADFTQSALWQKRSQFEPREVAGRKFYVRTDEASGRVVAFAAQDDVLVLGTREDLVAATVSLLGGQKLATLQDESWFVEALKAAPRDPSELRMVIHLAEVAMTPQFRTYWLPRNITEMRQYESSVSDLTRDPQQWREDRSLLLKKVPNGTVDDSARAVADLVRLVPPDIGFYRASAVPSSKDTLAQVDELLMPRPAASPESTQAPNVAVGDGTTGRESDLDIDISVAPPTTTQADAAAKVKPDAPLEQLLTNANVQAALQVHRSAVAADGVFVGLHSAIVLAAEQPWNDAAARDAMQRVLAPATTTASLGAAWKTMGSAAKPFVQLDGLSSITLATRGRYLIVANDPALLSEILARMDQKPNAQPAIYIASFDHQRERENYYKLTSLIDHTSTNQPDNSEPRFFSQDVASLSRTLSGVKSQTVTRTRDGMIERQSVVYIWE
jgi:hypothetical protein